MIGVPGNDISMPFIRFDTPPVVVQERGQASPNAHIERMPLSSAYLVVHVIAFEVRYHFQSQLVMIAQEQAPLADIRDMGSLVQNFSNWLAVFQFRPMNIRGISGK